MSPVSYALHQNSPNPFNPTTVIGYDVPAPGGRVTLRVYDSSGRLVRVLVDDFEPQGAKNVTWDGRNVQGVRVATGVFFYELNAPGFRQTLKMTLLK